jgi:hypothetical protein
MDTIVARLRDGALARGSRVELAAAAEGVELTLDGGSR